MQSGDRIVDVNGVATPTWESVFNQLKDEQPNATFTFTVERNNTQQKLTGKMPAPPAALDSVLGYPLMPPVADEIAIGSPAEHAGMKEGDVIVAIDGKPIVTWLQLVDGVVHSDGRPIQFTVRRDGRDISFNIAPMRTMGADGNMVWQIGVSRKVQEKFERQSLATAGNVATVQTGAAIKQIGMVLGGLFTGKVKIRQLTSVVGIARESGRAAKRGPVDLIWLMAIIGLNLGLLNLPNPNPRRWPRLDAGHRRPSSAAT